MQGGDANGELYGLIYLYTCTHCISDIGLSDKEISRLVLVG